MEELVLARLEVAPISRLKNNTLSPQASHWYVDAVASVWFKSLNWESVLSAELSVEYFDDIRFHRVHIDRCKIDRLNFGLLNGHIHLIGKGHIRDARLILHVDCRPEWIEQVRVHFKSVSASEPGLRQLKCAA